MSFENKKSSSASDSESKSPQQSDISHITILKPNRDTKQKDIFKDVANFVNPHDSSCSSIEVLKKNRDDSISTGMACHGVEPNLFLDYQLCEDSLITMQQCVACECVPYPDECMQCTNCDSLICSSKSAEIKTSCPYCDKNEKLNSRCAGFPVQPLNNRLVLETLKRLKVKCLFCDKTCLLDDQKLHLRMQHTQLTCCTPNCTEPIEDGVHCKKTSCMVLSKWLDLLKEHKISLEDKNARKVIEFTSDTINNLSARIDDLKVQIDNQQVKVNPKEGKFGRNVSFSSDVKEIKEIRELTSGGGSLGFKKTKSYDSNLFKLGQ